MAPTSFCWHVSRDELPLPWCLVINRVVNDKTIVVGNCVLLASPISSPADVRQVQVWPS